MSSTSERRIKEVEEFVKELCSQGQKIGLEGAILFNDMELIDQQAILRRDKFYFDASFMYINKLYTEPRHQVRLPDFLMQRLLVY